MPIAIWFTGLPASGKTTLANAIYSCVGGEANNLILLDGDQIRGTKSHILGYNPIDRDLHIERVITMAQRYQSAGYNVIASFISPYTRHRRWARERLTNFIEVFVDCPLSVCEKRDPKGLYAKARKGEINYFTGISDPYEAPVKPEIHLRTDKMSIDSCIEEILYYLGS